MTGNDLEGRQEYEGDHEDKDEDTPKPMSSQHSYDTDSNNGETSDINYGDLDAIDNETATELERIQEVARTPLFEE